eukprot:Rhum_TRINITY_DN12850_c0_g1::Rhum_TRINITY_DN12850_c0_g1_i1::g.54776::m.54776
MRSRGCPHGVTGGLGDPGSTGLDTRVAVFASPAASRSGVVCGGGEAGCLGGCCCCCSCGLEGAPMPTLSPPPLPPPPPAAPPPGSVEDREMRAACSCSFAAPKLVRCDCAACVVCARSSRRVASFCRMRATAGSSDCFAGSACSAATSCGTSACTLATRRCSSSMFRCFCCTSRWCVSRLSSSSCRKCPSATSTAPCLCPPPSAPAPAPTPPSCDSPGSPTLGSSERSTTQFGTGTLLNLRRSALTYSCASFTASRASFRVVGSRYRCGEKRLRAGDDDGAPSDSAEVVVAAHERFGLTSGRRSKGMAERATGWCGGSVPTEHVCFTASMPRTSSSSLFR